MGERRHPDVPSSGDDSSVALLHRAQAGDAEARERLYRRLLPIMRRWARGQVPEKARAALDSDDLVQATLTETLAQVQVFEPRRDHGLHLYLREALRNQIRDELRRLYRDPERAEELPESVPDDAPSPYENTVSRRAPRALRVGAGGAAGGRAGDGRFPGRVRAVVARIAALSGNPPPMRRAWRSAARWCRLPA